VKERATLKEVAKAAGVSTATVSNVLNDTKYVSEELKQKIFNVMHELNYQPNALAKSLRVKESKLIGLMISDIANPFFSLIVRGIEDTLNENGYNVLLCNSDSDIEKEKKYLEIMMGRRVDGLVISSVGNTGNCYSTLKGSSLPIVFLNRCPEFKSPNIVLTDNFYGAYIAAKHLIEHNYKKIAVIAGPQDISTGKERFQGFKQALDNFGIELLDDYIKIGDFTTESGYNSMKELMTQDNKPEAVFISNNLMTLGAYTYAKECKVKIPDQAAIIGFNDPEWAKVVDPPLTAVKQPAYEQGVHAVKLILGRIKGKADAVGQVVTLEPEFIIRESCGCRKCL
jgi:LacI family transcriptional regulator